MLPFFVAYCVVGVVCLVLGLLVWKKGMLGLTRGYQVNGFTDEKAYGAASGKAYLLLGAFFIAVGAAALPERIPRDILQYMTIAGVTGHVFLSSRIQRKYGKTDI